MKSITYHRHFFSRSFVCWILLGTCGALSETFTEEERAYWVFQPIANPSVPEVKNGNWIRNPVDGFVLDRLENHGLKPSPEADRRTLIRRATLDLHGIPPTIDAVEAFVNNPASDAYEQLIDQLLESPLYGERYARHWLDLVRYADTDGFKADVLRPEAWRYRDYVIKSLNEDKPYKRFVEEQIAGDELYPESDDATIATGFLRLWPYEDNQPDMSRHWEATLDDIADVSGDVFLGLSMKCARCHDHKFDSITQKDYFQFRSFFAALSPWEDVRLGDQKVKSNYQQQRATWEAMTAGIHAEITELEMEPWNKHWQAALAKLPPYMQEIMARTDRTPYEEQLARFGDRLMNWRTKKTYKSDIKGDAKIRWTELQKELATYDAFKPKELPSVAAVRDIGGTPPESFMDTKRGRLPVQPGFLSVLDLPEPEIEGIVGYPETTGRRAALADWLTDGDNPLSIRVAVNRLWQWHFGKGIVSSSNDFGKLGDRPSHPELLDWLAKHFVEQKWSMKSMHRLLMTSATYRQTSFREDETEAEAIDIDNRLLWKMPVRRMDAEQLRDSLLFVSGEIDTTMEGPAVSEEDSARRSIYVVNKRNKLRTMMNAFDTPDLHNSCHLRDVTTTPIQALALINGAWTLSRAEHFATRLMNCDAQGTEERIQKAFQFALGRDPASEELTNAVAFVESLVESLEDEKDAWIDFSHVLMNTNEFVYIN